MFHSCGVPIEVVGSPGAGDGNGEPPDVSAELGPLKEQQAFLAVAP